MAGRGERGRAKAAWWLPDGTGLNNFEVFGRAKCLSVVSPIGVHLLNLLCFIVLELVLRMSAHPVQYLIQTFFPVFAHSCARNLLHGRHNLYVYNPNIIHLDGLSNVKSTTSLLSHSNVNASFLLPLRLFILLDDVYAFFCLLAIWRISKKQMVHVLMNYNRSQSEGNTRVKPFPVFYSWPI